jgi:hypothetical protein
MAEVAYWKVFRLRIARCPLADKIIEKKGMEALRKAHQTSLIMEH